MLCNDRGCVLSCWPACSSAAHCQTFLEQKSLGESSLCVTKTESGWSEVRWLVMIACLLFSRVEIPLFFTLPRTREIERNSPCYWSPFISFHNTEWLERETAHLTTSVSVPDPLSTPFLCTCRASDTVIPCTFTVPCQFPLQRGCTLKKCKGITDAFYWCWLKKQKDRQTRPSTGSGCSEVTNISKFSTLNQPPRYSA